MDGNHKTTTMAAEIKIGWVKTVVDTNKNLVQIVNNCSRKEL
jgi:hypothetical protein